MSGDDMNWVIKVRFGDGLILVHIVTNLWINIINCSVYWQILQNAPTTIPEAQKLNPRHATGP